MNSLEMLTALLILKQPSLLGQLKVEQNAAQYIYRAVRTAEGVTVRLGQRWHEANTMELLPRIAEAAVSELLDESRAQLIAERAVVRERMLLAGRVKATLAREIEAIKQTEGWATETLATEWLLNSFVNKYYADHARLAEIDMLLNPEEEDGED